MASINLYLLRPVWHFYGLPVDSQLSKAAAVVGGFLCADGRAVTFEFGIKMGIARAGANGVPVYGSPRLTKSAYSDNKFAGTTVLYGLFQPKGSRIG